MKKVLNAIVSGDDHATAVGKWGTPVEYFLLCIPLACVAATQQLLVLKANQTSKHCTVCKEDTLETVSM